MFERLSQDNINDITKLLDPKSITNMSVVSHNCNSLFGHSNVWKVKVVNEFNIESARLNQYEPSEEKLKSVFYKTLYNRLTRLALSYSRFLPELKKQFENPYYRLIACLDDVSLLLTIPYEDEEDVCKLALYAGCRNIGYYVLRQFQERSELQDFFSLLGSVGYLELFQELTNPNNPTAITPHFVVLNRVISARQTKVLNYLLNTQAFGFNKNDVFIVENLESSPAVFKKYRGQLQQSLSEAAQLGDVKLVQDLLIKFPALNQWINQVLYYAKYAPSTDLVAFLLNTENQKQFGLVPQGHTLDFAAKKGDLNLVKTLCGFYHLVPDNKTLLEAVRSGNLELVNYLIQLGLEPTQETLNKAASLGHAHIVKYFLSNENFGLKQNHILPEALLDAAEVDSLAGVMYLLDPKNNFNFKPDPKMLLFSDITVFRYLLNPAHGFNLKSYVKLYQSCEANSFKKLYYLLDPSNNFNFNLKTIENNLPDLWWGSERKEFLNLLKSESLLKDALENLKVNHFDDAKNCLEVAYVTCFSHYLRVMSYALSKTNPYQLNEEARAWLSDFKNKLEQPEIAKPNANYHP